MKPILFNTVMVRAILDGRKSVTRRVVKPQPPSETHPKLFAEPPYRPGDILYVRETWARIGEDVDSIWFENPGQLYNGQIIYRADFEEKFSECRWRPSIHMPKEAARLFLRVTGVQVERLLEITRAGALKEGANPAVAVLNFETIWDSTIKKADLPRYGWEADPWVFVISFERITKDEAMQ